MLIINVRPTIPATLMGLSKFKGALRSTKEPMEQAVDDVIIPRIESNFDTQSSPTEGGWDPLSDVRVMRSQLGAYYNPILSVTGRLRQHATMRKYWQFNGQASTMAMVGPLDLPYARLQQDGGPNRGLGGKMSPVPARPYIDISEADIDAIGERIAEYAASRGVL